MVSVTFHAPAIGVHVMVTKAESSKLGYPSMVLPKDRFVDPSMRRPPNLSKTMRAPQPVQAPAEPGPPANYLDLYGLAKPPFGQPTESADYILFPSHRRAFELLADHIMNGSGILLLVGEEGIGKTQTLHALASVAAESNLQTIMVSRPPNGRISRDQLVSALGGQPETFHQPPRKALLADDIALMPQDCISLLLSLGRQAPGAPAGSAIILSSSANDLSRPNLAELVGLARNTIRLLPLGAAEIRQYIERSLWTAGGTTRRLIAPDAMKLITARCGGAPGTIDRLMEAVLTAGYARGDSMITARTVTAAMGPPTARSRPYPQRRRTETSGVLSRAIQIVATGLLLTGASVFLYKGLTDRPPQAPAMSAVATQPRAEPPPTPEPAVATLTPDLMAAVMKRGNESLALGDVASARMLFQRAAEAGSAAAITALGKTYDPSFSTANARDPARAAQWYQKAIALGDPTAADLLKRLNTR
jgi:type II secretory pathway predicted ATPase ExeA